MVELPNRMVDQKGCSPDAGGVAHRQRPMTSVESPMYGVEVISVGQVRSVMMWREAEGEASKVDIPEEATISAAREATPYLMTMSNLEVTSVSP